MFCASLAINVRPSEIRGRRECRAFNAPAASRAIKTKHTSVVTTVTPETPGIPRAMVYGLYRALPGDRAFLPPSPLRSLLPRNLIASVGASGPHDFAVREAAPSSEAPLASTASRLAFVTFASRPPFETGRAESAFDLGLRSITSTCDRLTRRANQVAAEIILEQKNQGRARTRCAAFRSAADVRRGA